MEKLDLYKEFKDKIPNLQLLEGIENEEKSSKDFKTWLDETYPDQSSKKDFMKKHYIPESVDLKFENFEEFIQKRSELLKNKLKQILPVSNT